MEFYYHWNTVGSASSYPSLKKSSTYHNELVSLNNHGIIYLFASHCEICKEYAFETTSYV